MSACEKTNCVCLPIFEFFSHVLWPTHIIVRAHLKNVCSASYETLASTSLTPVMAAPKQCCVRCRTDWLITLRACSAHDERSTSACPTETLVKADQMFHQNTIQFDGKILKSVATFTAKHAPPMLHTPNNRVTKGFLLLSKKRVRSIFIDGLCYERSGEDTKTTLAHNAST